MIKKEPSFFLPDCPPDVPIPPGFQPQPPTNSVAAESSANPSSVAGESGFLPVHGQKPDSSGEQPRRRTSRKRVRPKFYAPPTPTPRPAGPRRRGRPLKARFMPQLSRQEIETRNGDQVSLTPLRRSQGQMPCFIRSLGVHKDQSSSQANSQVTEQSSQINISQAPRYQLREDTKLQEKTLEASIDVNRSRSIHKSTDHAHDIEDTLIDISLTEVPIPVSGYGRGNIGSDDRVSQGMDLDILQHVTNALHYMTGNQTAGGGTKVKSRFSDIDQNLADTLKAIKRKHGDITQDCSLESDYMKTLVLLGICKVVRDLQAKQIKDVDIGTLDSYYTALKDAENMKVNVKWLHNRLDEIRDAVRLTDTARSLVNERNRRTENIDKEKKELTQRKVELDRLKSEIEDIENQLAQEAVMVEELNRRINAQTSKSSKFQDMYVMEGLI